MDGKGPYSRSRIQSRKSVRSRVQVNDFKHDLMRIRLSGKVSDIDTFGARRTDAFSEYDLPYGYILPMSRSNWTLATLKSLNAP
jgi:hypothetical protein